MLNSLKVIAHIKSTCLLWLLTIVLIGLNYNAFSQSTIDSLKIELKTAKDTSKVNVLNSISKLYERPNPDSSMHYATQAEALAKKLNYRVGEVAAIKNKGNYYVRIGDFDKAMIDFDRAQKIYVELGDMDGLQKILNNKGNAYRISGDYDKALYNFLESLKLSEKEGYKQGIAYASLNIGTVLYATREKKANKQGLDYFLKALEICKEIKDDRCIAYALNNLALIHERSEEFDKALNYLKQALEMKKAINDENGVATTLGNISDIYLLKGDYETALKYSQEALGIVRALNDERGIIFALLDSGKASYLLGKNTDALNYLNEALERAKESNTLKLIQGSYEYLHDYYLAQNNHKKALENYVLYAKYKDSIFNEESSKQIAEMRTQYDTEKKEAEIVQLTNEKTIQDLKLKKSENTKLFFIIASLLTFFMAGFAFYAYKQKQKANVFLEERNKFEIENKKRAISLFGQQVSKEVALELLSDSFNSGSKQLFAFIMFLDIRDFTVFAEKKNPSEIIQFQNDVFGFMIESISKHKGIINQFLGDGFMATFGAPASSGNDCQNAVDAAFDIVNQLNKLSDSGTIPKTKVGIGLHAGQIVTGNVGTVERKQYTITGNTVILASRIEQLNKSFDSEILISKEVFEKLNNASLKTKNLGKVNVKGRTEPIEIIRLA